MHHSPPQMLTSYLIKGERPSLLLHVFYELQLWHIVNQSGSAKETVSPKIGKNIEILALLCPDVFWYHLNSMGTQTSLHNTFSIYISHKNWMKYSVWILKNKNIFKRHKHPSPNALNTKYFWILSYNYCRFLGITKISNL